jgi:hypothetical protein
MLMFVPDRKHAYGPPRPVTGIALLFYVLMFVPDRKHAYGTPRPVTGITLLFYMLMLVPHKERICGPPQPVTGIALLFYMLMFVPDRKHLWPSTACYAYNFMFTFFTTQTAKNSRLCSNLFCIFIATFCLNNPD